MEANQTGGDMEGNPIEGTYLPTSQSDAERVAVLVEDSVIEAPTLDERERRLRIASAYWQLADSWTD